MRLVPVYPASFLALTCHYIHSFIHSFIPNYLVSAPSTHCTMSSNRRNIGRGRRSTSRLWRSTSSSAWICGRVTSQRRASTSIKIFANKSTSSLSRTWCVASSNWQRNGPKKRENLPSKPFWTLKIWIRYRMCNVSHPVFIGLGCHTRQLPPVINLP